MFFLFIGDVNGLKKVVLVIGLYVWPSQGAMSCSEEVDEFRVDGGEG